VRVLIISKEEKPIYSVVNPFDPVPMARDTPSASINADELFEHCERVQLPVCRQCRHCVWPEQIIRHLQGREHRLSSRDARFVRDVVQQWPNILHIEDPLPMNRDVVPYIPALELHRDGLLCTAAPDKCRYICRTEKAMATHFSEQHRGFRGARGVKCQARREEVKSKPWRSVDCQRLFPSRHGSQFFEVEGPQPTEEPAASEPPPPSKIEQARQMLTQRVEKIQDRERRTIEEGVYNAPSPWLQRTGWTQHLRKLDRDELLQSIATLEMDEEPVARVIWEAMVDIMRQC
jgi:hypothetical protein